MQQKLAQNSLQQEVGAFRNNIEKETENPSPKLKNMYIIYLRRIFALLPSNASSSLLQTCINFAEKRL